MFTRRTAVAAVLLALFGAACGSNGSARVAAQGSASSANATPAAASSAPTSTPSTAAIVNPAPTVPVPTTTAATPTTPAPTPQATQPAPASIEVEYQPHEGSTASATIDGPNGAHSKSLASGAAIFGELPSGTYHVTITVDTPSGDPTVGDARQIINGKDVHVEPGDRATIACDDNGCAGTL
ncbi:MAG TPA: hypothetical protein VGZ52_12725 [Acidimicrobiales bacterium]|jgi:hypothetical protein|nr:hypothetical protein [Acidimicrobiales bacterium]